MFYVFTIYIAKLASLEFLLLLARPNMSNRRDLRRTSVKGVISFIAVWLVVAIFCIAFQCALPHPWNQNSEHCFNRVCLWLCNRQRKADVIQLGFWISNGTIDVVSQILIALAPIYLLFNLHLPVANKLLAFVSFTPTLTYGQDQRLLLNS